MGLMTATTGSSQPHHGRPRTVADLEAMPDDGYRYELIDGTLIVSPAPSRRHQRVASRMFMVLELVCPDEFEVLSAPFAVRPSDTVELQPDVLVAREADLTDKLLPVAPVLAVEVLSPSTTLNDFNNKKAVYERLGVRSYWIVDPHAPTMTVFELIGGTYQQVAEVKGDDVFEAALPFPVRVMPSDLLAGKRQPRS